MRIFEPTKSPFVPRIRIINLVDVLFILLIFFIATTTFRVASQQPTAVKLALPEAKSAEEVGKQKSNQVRITVTTDGTVYLGPDKITTGKLEKALADAKAKNPDIILELSADKLVGYGIIVGVVDAARVAGIRNITAFTKKSAQ
ncbi:MAG: biopolymer transporter ExbD [Verrucomicrobiota bacterium]